MSKNKRVSLKKAEKIAKDAENLWNNNQEVRVAGSIRRKTADVGDIDLCVAGDIFLEYVERFKRWVDATIITKKTGMVSGGYKDGVKIELYVGPKKGFGALLLFATGSWRFNVIMRSKAAGMGYKLNQYGLFRVETDVDEFGFDRSKEIRVAGETEEEVFEALGMDYKTPEERDV